MSSFFIIEFPLVINRDVTLLITSHRVINLKDGNRKVSSNKSDKCYY